MSNNNLPNYSLPSSQNSWRNNYQNSLSKSQAQPLHQSQGGTPTQPYRLYAAGTNELPSSDPMNAYNAKILRLEKENSQLNYELQKLRESDGMREKKMEHFVGDMDDYKTTNERLLTALHEAQDQAKVFKEGKEELFLAVVNLNERIEMQNKTAAEAQSIWAKLPAAIKALKRLDDEAVKLRRDKITNDAEKENLTKMIIKLQETAEAQLVEMTLLKSKMESERNYYNSSKASLEETNASTTSCIASLVTKLEESKANNDRDKVNFHTERNALLDELERLRSQLATRSMIIESMSLQSHTEELKVDTRGKESFLAFIDDLKNNLLRSEMKRKQLHNLLQELRGNIRVFVRCRPFLGMDGDEQYTDYHDPSIGGCVKFYKDGSSVSLVAPPGARDKPQVFGFDHVFKCESTQDEVYKEVSDLVQSALDGFKVCIFSYGQTGSGKTHTMTGDYEGKMRGIIPRAVEQILNEVIDMRGNGWEIVVTMSMVEIYNEELRDLLEVTPHIVPTFDAQKRVLKVSNLQGFVTIAGLTDVELNSHDTASGMRQLEGLLEHAARTRMTACTAMNERSSRSHALFMLDINAKHCDGTTFLKGGLRLVDLAGSERLDRTGTFSDPARFKETVNINKSLSCLADVFVSLANKATHVPYRNSKLTMVLQDCLSNDGKALMFVNVSPTLASSQETLCSLRFANQVSQVELGKATKHVHQISPSNVFSEKVPSSEKDHSSVRSAVTTASEAMSKQDRNILSNIVTTLQGSLQGSLQQSGGKNKKNSTTKKGPKGPRVVSMKKVIRPSGPKMPVNRVEEKKVLEVGDYSETSSESSVSFHRN